MQRALFRTKQVGIVPLPRVGGALVHAESIFAMDSGAVNRHVQRGSGQISKMPRDLAPATSCGRGRSLSSLEQGPPPKDHRPLPACPAGEEVCVANSARTRRSLADKPCSPAA